ncbi:MAG: DsrE/DsrF/DrsH-like family protein [Planctomycetia bacterium]|nr:DsrE/DsrF/DrsH-like family protein [Planctomycetia bacterium]
METDKKGLSIIFHSGSYDRVYHGFSIVLVALALGQRDKVFFTYWALQYLVKGKAVFQLNEEGQTHRKLLEEHMKKATYKIYQNLTQAKSLTQSFMSAPILWAC